MTIQYSAEEMKRLEAVDKAKIERDLALAAQARKSIDLSLENSRFEKAKAKMDAAWEQLTRLSADDPLRPRFLTRFEQYSNEFYNL